MEWTKKKKCTNDWPMRITWENNIQHSPINNTNVNIHVQYVVVPFVTGFVAYVFVAGIWGEHWPMKMETFPFFSSFTNQETYFFYSLFDYGMKWKKTLSQLGDSRDSSS